MFCRCRISTEEGIPVEEMGVPPIEKTTDGRANARGIITHDDVAEYVGIEYKSVMHNDGHNRALFDPDLFECVGAQVHVINTIDYKKHIIK